MNIKLPVALIFVLISWGGFLVFFSPEILAVEGDVLISDNFSDGNLDGWTIQYGNWYINPQGNLTGSNSGKMLGGRINTGNSEWDNYQIELDVNGFQGIDQGIGFRYASDSFYEVNLRYNPGQGQDNTPEIKLVKNSNNQTTTLVNTHTFPLISNKWYHVKIEALNESIKLWVNNILLFDLTDTGTDIKKGTVAFSYWSGAIGVAYMKFDNVKVTALTPPPPPRLPVIFIPGIGGSEFKAAENIFWANQNDGHGGKYSHAYSKDEKIWVNQDKAAELGDDDYFDVLRLKSDGVTPEADLVLTGSLTSFGYSEIDQFFTGMGYVKDKNFFIYPYDWRKDIRHTQDSLDNLIEQAKQKSGQDKVNLVVHSMGGLVARYYISDPNKAAKVNKLIELGVPHLGAVNALKTLMYGTSLEKNIFGFIPLGIPTSETRDVFQNLPSGFQLLPSKSFFNFYDDSSELPFPFRDERDIDHDKITGSLNFNQIKGLLSNLSYNMGVFSLAEQFHNLLDPLFKQTNGTKVYEIVGTSQPTLGQIRETWWITWPVNLIPKTDEIYINGDGTVPLYSASLKNGSLDLSGTAKIYYVEQEHGNLTSINGTAMQTVKAILNDDNALPVEVKDEKIVLEGEQVSLDDGELDLYDEQNRHCGLNDKGEIEENIPDVTCTTSGNTKHAFVKKKAGKVKVKVTRKKPAVNSKTTVIKKRTYKQDKISKTTIYKDLTLSQTSKIEFILDPAVDPSPALIFYPDLEKTDNVTIAPTAEIAGSAALDQTPPATSIQISGTQDTSGIYTDPVTVTLTGNDSNSGILRIEYSLDNGQTVQTYTQPFTISASGKNTLEVKAIDKLGNEEIPQSIIIEITVTPPSNTPGTGFDSPGVSSADTSKVGSDSFEVNSTEVNTVITPPVIATPLSSVIASERSERGNLPTSEDSSLIAQNDNVLGITFQNPSHISDQINTSNILGQQENLGADKITPNPTAQILGGLLIVSGGIITLASLGLIATFSPWNLLRSKTNEVSLFRRSASPVKPFPK